MGDDLRSWYCIIGEASELLGGRSDLPMRQAVAEAFHRVTGSEEVFIFSGWAAQLDESQRAVVEDREPDPYKLRDELMERLIPIEEFIASQQESAEEQIGRLAEFIMHNVPDEPSESAGAVDTAIRLLGNLGN